MDRTKPGSNWWWSSLGFLLLWGCTHAPRNVAVGSTSSRDAAATETQRAAPYTRRTESTNGLISLEVALRRFTPATTSSSPVDLWLVGVTHLGTSNYYGRLQKFLDAREVVLFEGIGATNGNFRATEGEGFALQPSLARALGLRFQLASIDYQRPNWRNSDLSLADLQRQLPSDGPATGMNQLMALFQGEGVFGSVARLGVSLVGASPQLRAVARLMLIETLSGFDGEVPDGVELGIDTRELVRVLIEQRNEVVVRDLRKVLSGARPPASVAVFYGAGHMPDLERRLVRDLRLRPREDQWLRAFSVDLEKTGMAPADVEALRESIQQGLQKKSD